MFDKTRLLGLIVAAGALIPATGADAAPSDDQLKEIQRQLDTLKSAYESQIKALEARLKQAEADAKAAKEAASAKAVPAPAPVPPRAPVSANAFNPSINAVLNGTFSHQTKDPNDARVPGFVLGEEGGLKKRGLSLGESEVTLFANVDQALYGDVTLSVSPENEISAEEAYIQSTSLPWGFTVRGGRFFSGIGYLNERHAHDWQFIDAPLPYRVFLNNQYGDDGVQVRWLAPTDMYLELGGELFRGDSFPAGNAPGQGMGTFSLFAHTGGDIGASASWLGALSYLQTRANSRTNDDDVFTGRNRLGIASLVYKWAPDGNPVQRNLMLSGEYFRGRQDGVFNDVNLSQDYSGWYAQAVYQFMPRWKVGLRHDRLWAEGIPSDLAGGTLDRGGNTPYATSALLEYDTSEFGRFRFQYSRDDSNAEANNVFLAQYTTVFGPHPAHRY